MDTDTPVKSVVKLGAGNARKWWKPEHNAIHAAFKDHYGTDLAPGLLPPPPDPAALRARLRQDAPQLTALTDRIRHAFEVDQACAVLIPKLGMGSMGVDDKRRGIFALSVLLGDPTATIPFDHVLWDVRNQGENTSGHTSFSENDRKADYHTDNGTVPIPENFFLLYAIRAASCGGGVSLLRDARIVKKQLEETEEGRAAVRLLSETTVPRKVPLEFRPYGDVSSEGFLFAPVFSDRPMVRWRKNGIRRGVAANPEYDTPEMRQALDLMTEALHDGPGEIQLTIPTDGLLVINNHVALHGRTAFTDPERHLLRLRFHAPAN